MENGLESLFSSGLGNFKCGLRNLKVWSIHPNLEKFFSRLGPFMPKVNFEHTTTCLSTWHQTEKVPYKIFGPRKGSRRVCGCKRREVWEGVTLPNR